MIDCFKQQMEKSVPLTTEQVNVMVESRRENGMPEAMLVAFESEARAKVGIASVLFYIDQQELTPSDPDVRRMNMEMKRVYSDDMSKLAETHVFVRMAATGSVPILVAK